MTLFLQVRTWKPLWQPAFPSLRRVEYKELSSRAEAVDDEFFSVFHEEIERELRLMELEEAEKVLPFGLHGLPRLEDRPCLGVLKRIRVSRY